MKHINKPLGWCGLAAVVLMAVWLGNGQAQSPTSGSSQPGAQPSGQGLPETVIRISVNLVQVDAVVTDARNRPVTDLKADDFEILQDGKPQTVTNFSYVNGPPRATQPVAKPGHEAPGPPVELKPTEVRRAIALVVDDLGLSFEGIVQVQQAIRKFVDQQMQPGDLVAIVRTGAGIGALQQFTSDKRLLHAALDRVRFNPFGRGGISSFAPISSDQNLAAGNRSPNPASEGADSPFNQSLDQIYAVGSLGAVRYVIDGLRGLPGRKSLVLFSENIRIMNHQGMNNVVFENLRRLTDAASRSSVVIYTIDPRGLPTLAFTGADDSADPSGPNLAQAQLTRSLDYYESQDGLAYLARETGGLFINNENNIGAGMQRVIADTESYYLIGYHPAAGTFDPATGERKFHSLKVKVKRPGLAVRSRNGFYGVADHEPGAQPQTRAQQIAHALASPFTANEIHVRMTTLFSDWGKSYVTALVHVDARDLQFTDEPDGSHKATLDVVAITFGDNGTAVDFSDRTYGIKVKPESYQLALQNGFIFDLQHLVKAPGAYQMRLALRDTASLKLGTASQFIEVPDVKHGHLALSGIVLRAESPQSEVGDSASEKQAVAMDPDANEAVRIFKPGNTLSWAYQVLNPHSEGNQPPAVVAQTRLFHDGKEIYEGKDIPLDLSGQTDHKRLMAGGRLALGRQFSPGDYVLQVVVTDNLAKEKNRTSSQWIGFEVK